VRAVRDIGAGRYEAEYAAYGHDCPDAATRARQTRDAIELLKTMWTEESPVTHDGRYYDVEELFLEPKPVQDPHPPILVGGGGEQLTLRLTAHHADAWNVVGNTPESYSRKLEVLREHCADTGRSFDEIEKTIAHTVVLRETTAEAHEAYERYQSETEAGATPRDERYGAIGTPAEACEFVEQFRELGLDTFMIKALKNDRRTIELLVDEVMPEF